MVNSQIHMQVNQSNIYIFSVQLTKLFLFNIFMNELFRCFFSFLFFNQLTNPVHFFR